MQPVCLKIKPVSEVCQPVFLTLAPLTMKLYSFSRSILDFEQMIFSTFNIPMNPHVRLLVGRSVSLSVFYYWVFIIS